MNEPEVRRHDDADVLVGDIASALLDRLERGIPVEQALRIHQDFLALMQGKGQVEPDEDVLEDGIAFAGVAKFPARVKCALLSWMAWKDATAQALETSGDPR